MWFVCFQSSCTTSMCRARRAFAAESKEAVMSARMGLRSALGEQRLDEACEMTLDLLAQRRAEHAAAEQAPVGAAVERVEQEDRVHREHEEARFAVGRT